MEKQKKIIISVHDISPKFKKEFEVIFRSLNKLKIKNKEAFVILNWLEKYPLDKDKQFIQKLKKEFPKKQINLHGITHYSQKVIFINKILFGQAHAYLGEFQGKSLSKMNREFKSSIVQFKKIFYQKPLTFLPTRWQNSRQLLKICQENGIRYSEDSYYLINLEKNTKEPSPIVCFDYGNNRLLNYFARVQSKIAIFFAYLFNMPLRFSIHPNDIINGNFKFETELLEKLIKNKWTPITIEEFWKNKNKILI
jgi:predicted deacetylase